MLQLLLGELSNLDTPLPSQPNERSASPQQCHKSEAPTSKGITPNLTVTDATGDRQIQRPVSVIVSTKKASLTQCNVLSTCNVSKTNVTPHPQSDAAARHHVAASVQQAALRAAVTTPMCRTANTTVLRTAAPTPLSPTRRTVSVTTTASTPVSVRDPALTTQQPRTAVSVAPPHTIVGVCGVATPQWSALASSSPRGLHTTPASMTDKVVQPVFFVKPSLLSSGGCQPVTVPCGRFIIPSRPQVSHSPFISHSQPISLPVGMNIPIQTSQSPVARMTQLPLVFGAAPVPAPTIMPPAPIVQLIVVNNYLPSDTSVPSAGRSKAGESNFCPIAPATPLTLVPGFATERASQKYDSADRRRTHVCQYVDCKRTYFKNSHLKAHLRMHTGDSMFDSSCYV